MPMTEVTPQTVGRTSVAVLTWTDLGTDGLKFKNTGKEVVIIRRDAAATSTVTIQTNVSKDGLDLPDLTVAMAAGDSVEQFKPVGPFPTADYNQTGGWVQLTSDDSNDMIAVVSVTAVD